MVVSCTHLGVLDFLVRWGPYPGWRSWVLEGPPRLNGASRNPIQRGSRSPRISGHGGLVEGQEPRPPGQGQRDLVDLHRPPPDRRAARPGLPRPRATTSVAQVRDAGSGSARVYRRRCGAAHRSAIRSVIEPRPADARRRRRGSRPWPCQPGGRRSRQVLLERVVGVGERDRLGLRGHTRRIWARNAVQAAHPSPMSSMAGVPSTERSCTAVHWPPVAASTRR
jgi:hypothetical protein